MVLLGPNELNHKGLGFGGNNEFFYSTHCSLGDLDAILKMQFSTLLHWLVSADHFVIMPAGECHGTLLMICQHWFRKWPGAIRQQAITRVSVDPDLCHHNYGIIYSDIESPSPRMYMAMMILGHGNTFHIWLLTRCERNPSITIVFSSQRANNIKF